jgi:hypothetical protein
MQEAPIDQRQVDGEQQRRHPGGLSPQLGTRPPSGEDLNRRLSRGRRAALGSARPAATARTCALGAQRLAPETETGLPR